jgi:ribosome-binding protein aMBF1 (putative translation factor)
VVLDQLFPLLFGARNADATGPLDNVSKNGGWNKGFFQRDLAKMLGVDEMTIVNWEKGYTKPSQDKMKKLKSILKI